jgi:hypothetical protein
VLFITHATKKELPVGVLSGVPALAVQVSAYCSLAVAHMPGITKKKKRNIIGVQEK